MSNESDTQEEDEESLTEVASSSEGPNGTLPSALEMVPAAKYCSGIKSR